jgi:hypothetical protein
MVKYRKILVMKDGLKRKKLLSIREKRFAQIGREWIITGYLLQRKKINHLYPDFYVKPINPEEGD